MIPTFNIDTLKNFSQSAFTIHWVQIILGVVCFHVYSFGIRTTVFYAIYAMGITLLIGWLMGMLAGYFHGKTDTVIMRFYVMWYCHFLRKL